MRAALLISALFNLTAAVLFAYPSSALGQLAGLPSQPVPAIYRALLTMFVLLFAGAYAWLARQPIIHRPMVALAAIGKFAVFTLVLTFCLLGEVPLRALITATGDLALAALFTRWLLIRR